MSVDVYSKEKTQRPTKTASKKKLNSERAGGVGSKVSRERREKEQKERTSRAEEKESASSAPESLPPPEPCKLRRDSLRLIE